ncbi:hypothetical protein, partial [Comamonas odontotermitis]|uniref:hypothetical protein n=1 Tax=Comamonas odontotermitis TaxID=379895 RepID=UPI001C87498C
VCGAVLAPTPVRLTHHPSLLPLRPGFVQQSPHHRQISRNKSFSSINLHKSDGDKILGSGLTTGLRQIRGLRLFYALQGQMYEGL